MSATTDRELAEARAIIAAIRVQMPRLGKWTTEDDAKEKLGEILAADPADVLHAHDLLAEAEAADEESRVAERARAQDGADTELDIQISRLDARAHELKVEARTMLHRR